jgi:methionine-rich copper-binding protein CopC
MTLSPAFRPACFGLAGAFALGALAFGAAHAADSLQVEARSPAKDSFTSFPKSIHLTLNQPVKADGLDAQLMDPDGRRIRLTHPVVTKDGITVTPELTGGPPVLGPYEFSWKATAASGQAAQGRYTFFVQSPSTSSKS